MHHINVTQVILLDSHEKPASHLASVHGTNQYSNSRLELHGCPTCTKYSPHANQLSWDDHLRSASSHWKREQQPAVCQASATPKWSYLSVVNGNSLSFVSLLNLTQWDIVILWHVKFQGQGRSLPLPLCSGSKRQWTMPLSLQSCAEQKSHYYALCQEKSQMVVI